MHTTPFSVALALLVLASSSGCAIDDDRGASRPAKPPPADDDAETGNGPSNASSSSGGSSGTAPPGADAAAPPGSSSSSSSGATSTGSKRIFVTSLEYTGNLATAGGKPTGLEGGDALCAAHALDAGLGGSWVAWLSTSQVNAIDRLTTDGPWRLIDGTEIFSSRFDIKRGPAHTIDIDEQGEKLAGAYVFTGTNEHGHVTAGETCEDWTQAGTAKGMNGRNGALTADWTADIAYICRSPSRLYCFEQ